MGDPVLRQEGNSIFMRWTDGRQSGSERWLRGKTDAANRRYAELIRDDLRAKAQDEKRRLDEQQHQLLRSQRP